MDRSPDDRPPSESMTRRSFLKACCDDLLATIQELQGRPQLKLSTLALLPDEALASLMPVMLHDVVITDSEGQIRAQSPRHATPVMLSATDPVSLLIFNSFNGRMSLAEIAARVQAETGWEAASAFQQARHLFLHLVEQQVCVPANDGI